MRTFFWSFCAFALSALGTWLHILYARHKNVSNSAPREDRWHKKITPSMGGISMALSTILICFASGTHSTSVLKLLSMSLLMFLLGLCDDIFRFKPYVKLAGQIIVSCLAVYLGIHVLLTLKPIIYIPLSIFWIMAMTNSFNLIDNMDGLSGSTAVISIAFLTLYQNNSDFVGPMPWIVVGSILGFLLFNWNPAKIFMGDCGSHWIGFIVSAFAIMGTWRGASSLVLILLSPVLILCVPIFDTLLVSIQRKIHGLPISMGGKDHSSHRLVALGISERRTVLILACVSIVCGCIALLGKVLDRPTVGLAFSGAILLAIFLGVLLSDAKVYAITRPGTAAPKGRILPSNLFFKRRMAEVLVDTILMACAYTLSYLLRYDWNLDAFLQEQLQSSVVFVIAAKLLMFILLGLYEGFWLYIDFKSVLKIFKSCFVASIFTVLTLLAFFRFSGFSRTLFIIDFISLFLLMTGSRALLRWLREKFAPARTVGIRIAILGMNDIAIYLKNEILKHPEWKLDLLGCIRHWPHSLVDTSLTDLGEMKNISKIISQNRVEKLIVVCDLSKDDEDTLKKVCEESGASYSLMEPLGHSILKNLANDVN